LLEAGFLLGLLFDCEEAEPNLTDRRKSKLWHGRMLHSALDAEHGLIKWL
jgi:hypothetical protein